MSDQQSDDIRRKVQGISERAKNDRDYMHAVMRDPEGTLRDAGIPDETIVDVLGDWNRGAGGDVGGYVFRSCGWTCLGTTCDDLAQSC